MVKKTKKEVKECFRGGVGTVEFYHVLEPEELRGHGQTYAMGVLKPHSSVGYHQHVGNGETFYILKGEGIFADNDGSRIPVGPGDVCVIVPGESHGMENPTDEDLVYMALVINE